MTQSPAGWYPEPDPNHVGPPGRLRYWDGSAWTEHVHDPQAPAAPAPPSTPQPPAYPDAIPQYPTGSTAEPGGFAPIGGGQPEYPSVPPAASSPEQSQAPYGQQPYQPYQPYQAGLPGSPGGEPTTPDGERLAGWGQRVGAKLLDLLIQIPIIGLALLPLISAQWDSLERWIDDLEDAANTGAPDPANPPIFDLSTGPGITFVLIIAIVPVIYDLLFLLWKQATPGKMIVGLKVRLRERPGLPAGNVFGRVGVIFLLSNVCCLGYVLDVLWPLWDDKKQALHDKAAGTNVVRTR